MKQLGYKKSRNGCLRCKQRRIKCDEKTPCGACIRHSLLCSRETTGAAPSDRSSEAPAQSPKCIVEQNTIQSGSQGSATGSVRGRRSTSSPTAQTSPPSQSDPFNYFSRFLVDLNRSRAASDRILDLELMHHYTAVSYRSFSPCPAVQRTFQYDVPKEALSYPFLLHQILAFSAYHLAYLQPKGRHTYLVQANQHQNDAINRMRRTLSVGISPVNCHALFASSVFVTYSAFAAYPSHEKYHFSFSPIKSILNIFNLIVGMRVVLRESSDHLQNGLMHAFFARKPSDGPPAIDASLQPLFKQLPELSSRLTKICTMGDDGESEIVTSAVTALCECISQVSYSNVVSAPASLRALMLWPVIESSNYKDMVRQHHPAALVVLAYYCVIIHVAESSYWYLEGWAEALTSVISEHLVVTPWSELVVWPRKIIKVENC